MTERFDAVVIGGGHNGLTAAAYLGRAGLDTLVLERRDVLGGAAVTEEFHPGYRTSIAAYIVSLLRREIVDELDLHGHGLELLRLDGSVQLCRERHLFLTGEEAHDRAEIARHSARDYDAMVRFHRLIDDLGEVVRRQYLREPPGLEGGIGDVLAALRAGADLRRLTPELRHRLAQVFTRPALEIIEERFESPMMRAVFASHCVSGNFASLRQPGSAIPFFHHALGDVDGERGAWRLARGGMGAVSDAIARACEEHDVTLRTGAAVERILVEDGRVRGVALADGSRVESRVVLANTDPKRTFLGLVGEAHLPAGFAADIEGLRMGHATLRMNLALSGLPRFAAWPGAGVLPQHRSDVCIFPDVDGLEENYHAAARGELPAEPRVEIIIPSTLDDSLAPAGHHVMSLLCKYFPYHLSGGRSWDDLRDEVADSIIASVARHLPDLPDLVVGRQVLTPLDLERVFGLTEGDIFHGRHDLDQIFSLRPHPRAARYRTPVAGLYLCGAGAHPGGAVSGAPGYNAARRVLTDHRGI